VSEADRKNGQGTTARRPWGPGRQLLAVLICSAIFGALISGFLTIAWVNENLSGDFADQETGQLDVNYTALVFLLCAGCIAAPIGLIGVVGVLFAFVAGRVERGMQRLGD
jgi:hypothetical protein